MAKVIKISHYFEDIWQLREVQPSLLEALVSKDCLIEIVNGQPPYVVVIGVPHQAAVGVSRIADDWVNDSGTKGRDSDEGAAFYSLVAFTSLRDRGVQCKLVIAAHDTQHDSNKDASSPYWKASFSDRGGCSRITVTAFTVPRDYPGGYYTYNETFSFATGTPALVGNPITVTNIMEYLR